MAPTWGVEDVRRIVLCTGKVYYDLAKDQASDVAVIRIEQLYPFPATELAEEIARYDAGVEVCWLQEEPLNMGAWTFIRPRLSDLTGKEVRLISRPESASPATGSHMQHAKEQAALRDEAFS